MINIYPDKHDNIVLSQTCLYFAFDLLPNLGGHKKLIKLLNEKNDYVFYWPVLRPINKDENSVDLECYYFNENGLLVNVQIANNMFIISK